MNAISRLVAVVCLAWAVSCSPPSTVTDEPPAPSAAASSTDAVLAALTPVISTEIGKPVTLQATTANVNGGWAYVVAQTRNADGSAIDWSTTNLASRYENGAMDEGGGVYALLQEQNGAWLIVEHVIAPTDVAWVDWAERHNVPAGVVDVPGAATP